MKKPNLFIFTVSMFLLIIAQSTLSAQNVASKLPDGSLLSGRSVNETEMGKIVHSPPTVMSLKCPVPKWTTSAPLNSKMFCNSAACTNITVGDSAQLGGYMTPGWNFFMLGLDGKQCTDLTLEIWENGALQAEIGPPDPRCTGGCSYLGTWSSWFGSNSPTPCASGQVIDLFSQYFTPGASIEVRLYDTHPGLYSWTLRDNLTDSIAKRGVWNFDTSGTTYRTTGVNTAIINAGSATFSCPTCPAGSLIDFKNGTSTFCPGRVTGGKYGITYTFTSGSCKNSYTDTLTVNPNPVAASSQENINCKGNSTGSITAIPSSGSPAYTYTWSTGPTTQVLTGLPAGLYVVTVTDKNGCSGTTSVSLTEPTTSLSLSAPVVTGPGCGSTGGGTASTRASGGTGNYTYSWTPGGSTTDSIGNLSVGDYTVIVSDANGCTTTSTAIITGNPNPTAAFTPSVLTGNSPLKVVFSNASSGASTYLWYFGGGQQDTSTSAAPSHTFTKDTVYNVCLVAKNAGGCKDSVCKTIIVIGEDSIRIPNVFSPNGDGKNDQFIIFTLGIKNIEISIWDRWGLKIWEHNGPTASWDGKTSSGKESPSGTYYYLLKADAYDGKSYNDHGFVELIR